MQMLTYLNQDKEIYIATRISLQSKQINQYLYVYIKIGIFSTFRNYKFKLSDYSRRLFLRLISF